MRKKIEMNCLTGDEKIQDITTEEISSLTFQGEIIPSDIEILKNQNAQIMLMMARNNIK